MTRKVCKEAREGYRKERNRGGEMKRKTNKEPRLSLKEQCAPPFMKHCKHLHTHYIFYSLHTTLIVRSSVNIHVYYILCHL